jgi:putative acetyltransferase
MGYTQLYLESLPQFANAVKLYEKEGFRRLDNPLGDFIHSSCSIWMLKDLTLE